MGLFDFHKKEEGDAIKEICSFIVTTDILIDPSDAVLSQLGSQIFQFAIEQLKEKSPEFMNLYELTKNTTHRQGFGQAVSSNNYADCHFEWQKRAGYGNHISFIECGNAQIPGTAAKFSWGVFIDFVI